MVESNWLEKRLLLAQEIAGGLSGWYQMQISQRLEDLSGEDSAQLVIAQIINAQQDFRPKASQPFKGHEESQKRMDIALVGRSKDTSLYGAIEVKWANQSSNAANLRLSLIQDILRLSVVPTHSLGANFLVFGGKKEKIESMFNEEGRDFHKTRESRQIFNRLLAREVLGDGKAKVSDITKEYPTSTSRLPSATSLGSDKTIITRLLAKAGSEIGDQVRGQVYVWQCQWGRGRKKKLTATDPESSSTS